MLSKRNYRNHTPSNSQESSHNVIETAVPLIGVDIKEDERPEDHPTQASGGQGSTSTSDGFSNFKLFFFGAGIGIVLFSVSLGALELIDYRYGPEAVLPVDSLPEQILYATLVGFSFLWAVFYPLTCAIFFCVICGHPMTTRWVRVTGQYETETEAFFKMVAFLEFGFRLGSSLTGFSVEVYFGISPCWVAFMCSFLIDAIACYLLYQSCRLTTMVQRWAQPEESQDSNEEGDDSRQHYVAIV